MPPARLKSRRIPAHCGAVAICSPPPQLLVSFEHRALPIYARVQRNVFTQHPTKTDHHELEEGANARAVSWADFPAILTSQLTGFDFSRVVGWRQLASSSKQKHITKETTTAFGTGTVDGKQF